MLMPISTDLRDLLFRFLGALILLRTDTAGGWTKGCEKVNLIKKSIAVDGDNDDKDREATIKTEKRG